MINHTNPQNIRRQNSPYKHSLIWRKSWAKKEVARARTRDAGDLYAIKGGVSLRVSDNFALNGSDNYTWVGSGHTSLSQLALIVSFMGPIRQHL